MYGNKDNMTSVGKDNIKVRYHTHISLDEIPKAVRDIEADNLTIDKITKVDGGGYWRIDYSEIKPK